MFIKVHVLDYAIVNNGHITEEMIKDFNQENSTPVKIDLENISNRAICVIKEDLVLTAKDAIIHNSERLAEIIMSITKSKRVGRLNIVKVNKKNMKRQKLLNFKKKNLNSKRELMSKKSKMNRKLSKEKELKIQARTQATIDKMKKAVKKG